MSQAAKFGSKNKSFFIMAQQTWWIKASSFSMIHNHTQTHHIQ